MREKAVHIAFYPSDWLAGTRGLTPAETGIYITLTCMMYERQGPLPFDHARLARMCNCPAGTFKKILTVLMAEKKLIETPEGLWENTIVPDETPRRAWIPTLVVREVKHRDGEKCAYCGTTEGPFHLDHIVPWSRGGSDSLENLTVCCASCNWSKGSKTLDEWRGGTA